jgi:hypothetical protein
LTAGVIKDVCLGAYRGATLPSLHIRHVPDEQTLVLQCRPCGLSATETVDAPKPGEGPH